MTRRVALTVCLLVLCGWALTLVAQVGQTTPSPASARFEPVASLQTLDEQQRLQVETLAALLRVPPARRSRADLVRHAEILAELANVSLCHPLGPDRAQTAAYLRDASVALARAAKNRATADEVELTRLFQRVTQAFLAQRPEQVATDGI
ncbi:MAG TPA: hypothetical protein PKK06_11210 [Phycisphaerae bacterium]|nr:hypothetical protein [Phycisphaerae bacterium]HNU45808.1 hypothetical protein [Phycisphaerae bacterium]